MAEHGERDLREVDLPAELPRPARLALVGAGYVTLDELTAVTEDDVSKLHGMGPKALGQLRDALAARGRAFAR